MLKKIIIVCVILFACSIIGTFIVTKALGQANPHKTLYGEFVDLEKRVQKLEKQNQYLEQEIDRINNEEIILDWWEEE